MKPIDMKANNNNNNNNNNYRRMLKKANDKRPKSGAVEEHTQAASSASAIPRQAQARGVRGEQVAWTVVDTENMSNREKAMFKNQVPFSEEMYETIKASINILTDRTDRDNPQTPSIDEALWFRDAVEAIVADAHRYVLCYVVFLSFLVCDVSVSLHRSISACLRSLTLYDTSLTIIPHSINHQSTHTHITYYLTGTVRPGALRGR
jgi:hypothetical protein